MRLALLIFGALNAILYASLTPLWEGFDEPFHYGYVQHLRTRHTLPQQRQTVLSQEIFDSLPLAPASYLVKRNLPMVTTFDDYFRLPPAERESLRHNLDQLDPALAARASQALDYESQQAPLAYSVLAPFDALWSRAPLPDRVWRLRLLCALASALASGVLLYRLARLLNLTSAAAHAAVFLMFSSQMLYATIAHVANDWLALPLFLLVLTQAIEYYTAARPRTAWLMALALAAGLLTKAYFLALVPFVFTLVLLRRSWRALAVLVLVTLAAAPWYIRNLTLYRNLSGMQETFGGVRPGPILSGALHLPWGRALLANARTTLWDGNNSATSFSSVCIATMLLLLLAAVVCYIVAAWRNRPPTAECVLLAGLGCFALGLVYNNVVQWVSTQGVGLTASPWYVELLAPPGVCLLLAGLARSGGPGRVLRIALVWLWAYVICATYVAKLIPMYGGQAGRPIRLTALLHLYSDSFRETCSTLSTTALASPPVIFTLTAMVVVCAVALAARLSLQP